MAEIEAHCPTHGVLYEPRCHYCREYAGQRSRSSTVQRACDRCTQGVMDADGPNGYGNDHLYGRCRCACHEVKP